MENYKRQMSRAKQTRFNLSFIIFQLVFVMFETVGSAETVSAWLGLFPKARGTCYIASALWSKGFRTWSMFATACLREVFMPRDTLTIIDDRTCKSYEA